MTPLDAETQRLLAIYDAWLACRCGEQERWAEDGAGRCKHERALHYVAEEACEHIRALSERLARVEAQVQALLSHCPDAECHECGAIICPTGEPLHFHHDGCPACVQDEPAAAIRAGK